MGGGVVKSVGEEYKVAKRGREYHGCGEEYNVEKGRQYHLLYNIEAVGKRLSGEKEKGTEISGEKKEILKIGGGEVNQVIGNFIQPLV